MYLLCSTLCALSASAANVARATSDRDMSGRDLGLEDCGLTSGGAGSSNMGTRETGPEFFSSREVSCVCCLSGGSRGNWPGNRGLGDVGGGGGLRSIKVGGDV